MAETLTAPPSEFVCAERLTWEVAASDYPETDGWSLCYAFVAEDKQIKVPATIGTVTDAGAGAWTVTLSAAETLAQFTNFGDDGLMGEYAWQEYVEKTAGAERKVLRWGLTFVKRHLDASALASGLEIRSHVRKVLLAIRALIEGKATKDQASYSIAGRALARYSWDDLVKMESFYAAQYERELAQERFRYERKSPAIVKARMPAAGRY